MSRTVNSQYKRGEVIGRGNFGVVYKGYNVETRQVVAIKVLDLDTKEDEVRDVQHEITLLSQLSQNPDAVNITRYYGSYLHGTKLWIIMDLCSGGSIRTLLKPGHIDERYISVIVRELLLSLSYIHKEGVIHRDIKAANVLITNDGHLRLCDFGVAAEVSATKHKRSTIVGTPYWMAPEVITEGAFYNSKADIWSLGITVYEIACGNPPYSDQEAMRAIMLIPRQKPARLEGNSYSTALKEFVALCLDEHANERPTADELLKTKLVKTSKSLPTAMLKDLVQRYVTWKQKPGNNYRDSMAVLNKMRPVHLSDDEDATALVDKMAPVAKTPAMTSEEELADISNDNNGEWSSVEDTVWDFDIEGLPDNYQDTANVAAVESAMEDETGTYRQLNTMSPGTNVGLGLSTPAMNTVVNFNNNADGSKGPEEPTLKAPQSLLELFENNSGPDESAFKNYMHTPPIDHSATMEPPKPVEIEIPSFDDINSMSQSQAQSQPQAQPPAQPTGMSSMGPPPLPPSSKSFSQTSASSTPSPSISRKPSLYHSNTRNGLLISSTPNLNPSGGINSSNMQMRKRSPSPKRMEPLPSNGSNMRPLNFSSKSTTAIPSTSQGHGRGLERKNSVLSPRPALKGAQSTSATSAGVALADSPSPNISGSTPGSTSTTSVATTPTGGFSGSSSFKRPSRPTNLRIAMPMPSFSPVTSAGGMLGTGGLSRSATGSMDSRDEYEDVDTTLEDIHIDNNDGFPAIDSLDMSVLLDSTPRDRVMSQLTGLLESYSLGLKRIEDKIVKFSV